MSEVPTELKFLSSHEWVSIEGNIATIGVSDHAQELLGDLVYVELPDVGSSLAAGDSAGVIESVKAASDTYAPVSGEVIEVNDELEDSPDKINSDPYGAGWLVEVTLSNAGELDGLLDAAAYQKHCEERAG